MVHDNAGEYYVFEGCLSLKGLSKSEADEVTLKAAALDPDLFLEWSDEIGQYMTRHALAQIGSYLW